MADIPNVPIAVVPPEGAFDDPDFPLIKSITQVDSVGPEAANRQPNALRTRDLTLRDRINKAVEALNFMALNFVQRDGSTLLTGDLDANGFRIVNVPDPSAPQDAMNRRTLDAAVAALDEAIADLEDRAVLRDGSQAMEADLPMGGFRVVNHADPIADDQPVTLGYGDANYVRRDGQNAPASALSVGGFRIKNVAEPETGTDGAPRSYVDAVVQSAGLRLIGASTILSTGLNFSTSIPANEWTPWVGIPIGVVPEDVTLAVLRVFLRPNVVGKYTADVQLSTTGLGNGSNIRNFNAYHETFYGANPDLCWAAQSTIHIPITEQSAGLPAVFYRWRPSAAVNVANAFRLLIEIEGYSVV